MEKTSTRNFGVKGWILIIFSLGALFICCSMTIDGLNVYLALLTDGNGLDYNACLAAGTPAAFGGIVIMFILGKIREKIGSRLMSGVCLIITGCAFNWILLNSSSVGMYTIGMIIIVGCTYTCFYLCTGALQAQWFPRKRGVVVGISTTGANIASAVIVPLMTVLAAVMGWKAGISVFGYVAIVLGIIGLLVLRDDPLKAGFYPDNVSKEVYEREYVNAKFDDGDKYVSDWTAKRLLTTKETWLAAAVPGLCGLSLVGIISQFVGRNISLGLTQGQAVGAMTVAALCGIVGSYLFGVIDTKYGTKRGVITYAIFFAIAVVMNLLGQFHVVFVYISIVMIGASLGGNTNFCISWPASIFGQRDYPKANTIVFPVLYCINSLNFAVNAAVLKATGSLTIAYILYAIILVVAAIIAKCTDSTKWNKDVHPELEKLN